MFCPVCKLEYRPGLTHCTDCDVDLVENLDAPPSDGEDFQPPKVLWTGTNSEAFGAICQALDSAKVPHHKNERSTGLGSIFGSETVYAVLVHHRDQSAAESVLEEVRREFEIGDLPKNDPDETPTDDEIPEPEDDEESTEPAPEYSDEHFFAEDATAEIWSGEEAETAENIRICLREFRIECVVDELAGKKRVRVMPDSEPRAREIVREIVEGTPMK